jgi:hypothetical protein
MKTKSLEELTDEFIGPLGSMKRDAFEKELRLDILGAQIRQIRKDRNLKRSISDKFSTDQVNLNLTD